MGRIQAGEQRETAQPTAAASLRGSFPSLGSPTERRNLLGTSVCAPLQPPYQSRAGRDALFGQLSNQRLESDVRHGFHLTFTNARRGSSNRVRWSPICRDAAVPVDRWRCNHLTMLAPNTTPPHANCNPTLPSSPPEADRSNRSRHTCWPSPASRLNQKSARSEIHFNQKSRLASYVR